MPVCVTLPTPRRALLALAAAATLAVVAAAQAGEPAGDSLWARCASGLGLEAGTEAVERHIGIGAQMQDRLLPLILSGEKSITTTSPWLFEAGLAREPVVGTYSVLLDGTGRARAVLRTTRVETLPFDAVTAEHSRFEGEPVRPLEAWRAVHVRYFTQTLAPIGKAPTPDMPVTLEWFEVVCSE
jgi:uncharacterized protein YhfF